MPLAAFSSLFRTARTVGIVSGMGVSAILAELTRLAIIRWSPPAVHNMAKIRRKTTSQARANQNLALKPRKSNARSPKTGARSGLSDLKKRDQGPDSPLVGAEAWFLAPTSHGFCKRRGGLAARLATALAGLTMAAGPVLAETPPSMRREGSQPSPRPRRSRGAPRRRPPQRGWTSLAGRQGSPAALLPLRHDPFDK